MLKRSAGERGGGAGCAAGVCGKFSPRIEEVYQESSDAAGRGVAGRIGASKSGISGDGVRMCAGHYWNGAIVWAADNDWRSGCARSWQRRGFARRVAVSANFDTGADEGSGYARDGSDSRGRRKRRRSGSFRLRTGSRRRSAGDFFVWGHRTLGELAALPEGELMARIGPQARRLAQPCARSGGTSFQPIEPEFSLEEFCEFETPVEQIDSLLFMGARMIDCLVGVRGRAHFALATLIDGDAA